MDNELGVGQMLEEVWGKIFKVLIEYFEEGQNSSGRHVDKDLERKFEIGWVLEKILSEELCSLLVGHTADGYQLR